MTARPQKVVELLQQKKKELTFSVEITPPIRGTSISTMFQVIEQIRPFDPLWIDVTSHSADVDWIEHTDPGTFRKKVQRKSPGTIAICGAIEYKFNIPTVPHLLCYGYTREETEDALIDLNYLGIKNVLAIRGDGQPKQLPPGRTANPHALHLVEQIQAMNSGKYLYQEAEPTDFSVGVACYPEKHFEAPNFAFDIAHLKAKQDAGAAYANTQMFFDNQKFYTFMDRLKGKIKMPVIPSLKILSSAAQSTSLPKYFHVDLPEELFQKLEKAKSKEDFENIGVDWAYEQCLDLMDNGYNHIHFYIMQKTNTFAELMKRLSNPPKKRAKR